MWIAIDENRCMGHGRCYDVAADLLHDDEEGFVAERGTCFEVPAALVGQAQEAMSACPEGAIALTEQQPA